MDDKKVKILFPPELLEELDEAKSLEDMDKVLDKMLAHLDAIDCKDEDPQIH